MKKILQIALTILISIPLSINAQSSEKGLECGTSVDDLHTIFDKMLELRARHGDFIQTRGAIAYIPVCLHLVARADGTGRVDENKVLDMMDEWNKSYSTNGLELQFYIKYLNYVQHDALYNTPRNLAGTNKAYTEKKADALNIFICGTADDGTDPNSVTLAYYLNRFTSTDNLYAADWVVMRYQEASRENYGTVAHEVGHFFSLPHTFNGFECSPFRPTLAAPCAPANISCNGGSYSVEKAARTGADANCSTAGDGFCDTEPDYNFGITKGTDWNNASNPCSYNGVAKDPTCIAINPDEKNLMGYFIGCASKFSPLQVSAMRSDYLNNSQRLYLRNGNAVQSTTAVGLANLALPANNTTSSFFDKIDFDWSDVAGAYGYVFEVSTLPNFATNVKRFVSYTSNLTISKTNVAVNFFVKNTSYYWRVRAFGRYFTNTTATTAFKFTTGTVSDTYEIPGIEKFSVLPNPVGKSQNVEIQFNSENAFEAQAKLLNLEGKQVKSKKIQFNVGFNSQLIDISDLNQGMYILFIQSERGVLNKKIVISQ